MCGRYTLKSKPFEISTELDLDELFEMEPRYNIGPGQLGALVADIAPRKLQMMRWGLLPYWSNEPKTKVPLFNARAETVDTLASYREPFRKRRALVVLDGFYEWKKTPLGKKAMHIHAPDNGVMTAAGLWDSWKDAEGRELRTFTLITTTPNTFMADIHDRMPVFIPKDLRKAWLAAGTSPTDLKAMLVPCGEGLLVADEVSDQVNSVANEGPGLLEPPVGLF